MKNEHKRNRKGIHYNVILSQKSTILATNKRQNKTISGKCL